jgi:hypothetical protein
MKLGQVGDVAVDVDFSTRRHEETGCMPPAVRHSGMVRLNGGQSCFGDRLLSLPRTSETRAFAYCDSPNVIGQALGQLEGRVGRESRFRRFEAEVFGP